jgi:general secretion pathway protein C
VTSGRLRALLEVSVLAVTAFLAASVLVTTARLWLDDPTPGAIPALDAGDPAAAESLDAFRTIATRDVFNGLRDGAATRPRLALRLWGIGMHGDRAYAVIEDPATGRQVLYRTGDEIGDARVASIAWDHVVLRRPGGDESLPIMTEPAALATGARGGSDAPVPPRAPDATIRQTGPDAFIVERAALTGAVDNTSGLLTQLRAVPEVADGRPVGFRLFQINPESIFTRLGLRNGDVVQRVNGSTLANPASLLGFLQRLRDEPRVALDIVRAGDARTLVYDLR